MNKKRAFILRKLDSSKRIESFDEVYILSDYYHEIEHHNKKLLEIENSFRKSIEEEFRQKIKNFGHLTFKRKSIIERLSINNDTYWYYLRFSLYHHLIPKFFEYNLIKKYKSSFGTNEHITFFTKYKHTNIEGNITLNNEETIESKSKLNSKINLLIIFALRSFIGFYRSISIKRKENVILLEPYNQQKLIDIENPNQFIYGDYYNEYFTNHALKKDDFFFLSDIYPPPLNEDIKLKKAYFTNKYSRKSLNFEYFITIILINPINLYKAYKFNKQLKKNLVLDNKELTYSEALLLSFLRNKSKLMVYIWLREKAAKIATKNKKIKRIICHHEQSVNHFSIIKGGRENNLISVGIQHGVLTPYHMQYIYDSRDLPYLPTVDYMITWGEYWNNLLIDLSIYSKKNCFSLGQIRTDIIPKINQHSHNHNKKNILFASQPAIIGEEIRYNIAHDILLSAKSLDYNLIIKPHPGEKDAINFFKKVAEDVGYFDYSISNDDLYKLLSNSDCLITYHSTVSSEAVYFFKPVIILDYKEYDISDYSKFEGAIFTAKHKEELLNILDLLIKGELKISLETQKKFISNYSFSIDGKTSERYINFINSLK